MVFGGFFLFFFSFFLQDSIIPYIFEKKKKNQLCVHYGSDFSVIAIIISRQNSSDTVWIYIALNKR